MKYMFGPVPSRRLGQSLGIDTVPLKTCNWNCVYCQLGRSVPLVNERREYYPREEILTEVKEALAMYKPGQIDWITFVASGEPTLHSGIGWLIKEVKTITDIPIAVITNGALLYLPELRKEITLADAILPTLDAGTPELYRRINRPHPEATFARLVEGLIALRKEYAGKLWLEVMLVRDLNDTEDALRPMAEWIAAIQPDEIHLNHPTRPPAESWVLPSTQEAIERAKIILGVSAHVVRLASKGFDICGEETLVDELLAIVQRHPMSEEDITQLLRDKFSGGAEESLAMLINDDRFQVINRYGKKFFGAASAFYPENRSRHEQPQ